MITIILGLYALYNPTDYSIFSMWLNTDSFENLPFKLLITLLLIILIGLIFHGMWKTIGLIGVTLMVTVITVTIWTLTQFIDFNVLNINMWKWITQPILGIMLTIGWQWPKIWRAATGAVIINDPDIQHHNSDTHNHNSN